MYRPTVRYDEAFRAYVNDLFHKTHLDRNQIIRAALFVSSQSEEFKVLMTRHKKPDVLPSPLLLWSSDDHELWMEQSWIKREEERGVKDDRREVISREQSQQESFQPQSTERRTGQIHNRSIGSTVTRGSSGGIKITVH